MYVCMLNSQAAEENQRGSANQKSVIKEASRLEKMGVAVVTSMYRLSADFCIGKCLLLGYDLCSLYEFRYSCI